MQEGCNKKDLTTNDWKPYIAVIGESPYEATHAIVMEKEIVIVVNDIESFAEAVAYYFGILYIINIEYNADFLLSTFKSFSKSMET